MQQATEIRVGIFVVVVIILALFIASNTKGGLGSRTRGYEFEIWFQEAPGVGKGSPVRRAGVDIGQIVDKDLLPVTETVSVEPAADPNFSYVVTTWLDRREEPKDSAMIAFDRRLLDQEQLRAVSLYSRPRNVARLKVRVTSPQPLYTGFRYQIEGSVVGLGDRQLNISDTNARGLPMSAEERGRSVPALRNEGQRVAVLGLPPANLDKIVQNAQQVMDDETARNLKAVFANINGATAAAQKLVESLSLTAQGNQANVDRMMQNAAAASQELQAMLAESRILARQTLTNVAGTTDVARRVAEGNAGRLNRIVANADEATGSLSRMLRGNEASLRQALTSISGTAEEVRALLASSRQRLDEISASLTTASSNVNAMSAESRDRLASVMGKVDDSVGSVRDLLRESDADLRALIQNTSALTADARTTLEAVRADLPAIAGNLRTASANVAQATEELKAAAQDPAVRQVIYNAETATSDAREMIADLRQITADPDVQTNIKETTANLRDASATLSGGLGGFKSFKPYATLDVYYIPDRSHWQSNFNLSIAGKGGASYHLGVDNLTDDPLWQVQLGRELLDPNLRFRYGFYRSKLGIGADYSLWPGASVRTDLYDPGNLNLNARFQYTLPMSFTALGGVEDMFDRWDWLFGLQYGRPMP